MIVVFEVTGVEVVHGVEVDGGGTVVELVVQGVDVGGVGGCE